METKQQQREFVRKMKAEFAASCTQERKIAISEEILSRVECLPQFRSARVVLAYNSLGDEVYTPAFLNKIKAIAFRRYDHVTCRTRSLFSYALRTARDSRHNCVKIP